MRLLFLLVVMLQELAAPPAGTATVRGRVVDKESGEPIARAVVRLYMTDGDVHRSTVTDRAGRYEFSDLPPGTYSGFAELSWNRATHIEGPLFPRASRWETTLKAGEVRSGVDVALARSLAMTIRVIDEWGEPLSLVAVTPKSLDTGMDVNQYQPRVTDDLGRVRLYGLEPGDYVVCASPTSLKYLPDVEQPRGERFVRTCHPSTTDDEAAPVVRLDKGDLDGIEIRMRRGRAFTVSGTATDAAGAPLSGAHVISLATLHTNGTSSGTLTVDTGGHFTVTNVLPGDYAITARVGGPNRPGERREAEFAFVPIRVENADIEDLTIATARGVDVSGRFVVDNEMAVLPKSRASIFIRARPAGLPARLQGGTISAHPDPDLSFQFDGLFGRRTLDVLNVPTGWYVKSIRYGDTDVTDSAVNFHPSPDKRALEVVLSNRGATVSGRVSDDRGDPVSKARVYLVPADREQWSMGYDYTPSSSSGSFRVGPARAGDYVVVALRPGSRPPNFQNLRDIERLLAAGERVTLGTFEERTLDLTAIELGRLTGAR